MGTSKNRYFLPNTLAVTEASAHCIGLVLLCRIGQKILLEVPAC